MVTDKKITHKYALKTRHLILRERAHHVHPRNQLHHHDPQFVRSMMKFFRPLKKYFRYQARGLENVPQEKKCLVVMNHGVMPFHGFLLSCDLVRQRSIYPRGLGAGFLFAIPGMREFFLKGGVVNANNHNARALLAENACLILAPGGIYEALITKPGMAHIPWERRTGFVSLACETNTPIIPTYCHGLDRVYFNSKFLLKLRIKILERTRFSMPLFYGLGLLPMPFPLTHIVGEPISVRHKKGESEARRIHRIHAEVLAAMQALQQTAI